ncbi:hypothetical protein [Streptomyces triticirhizae]|nr:hypothetical protein [Streptomyces triticirhizae]
MEALPRERFDTLAATGRAPLAERPPREALTEWTLAFVTATTTFPGLTG